MCEGPHNGPEKEKNAFRFARMLIRYIALMLVLALAWLFDPEPWQADE